MVKLIARVFLDFPLQAPLAAHQRILVVCFNLNSSLLNSQYFPVPAERISSPYLPDITQINPSLQLPGVTDWETTLVPGLLSFPDSHQKLTAGFGWISGIFRAAPDTFPGIYPVQELMAQKIPPFLTAAAARGLFEGWLEGRTRPCCGSAIPRKAELMEKSSCPGPAGEHNTRQSPARHFCLARQRVFVRGYWE